MSGSLPGMSDLLRVPVLGRGGALALTLECLGGGRQAAIAHALEQRAHGPLVTVAD